MNRLAISLSTLLTGCALQLTPAPLTTPKPAPARVGSDSSVPEEYQEAAAFIEDVRQFGFQRLGLYKESKQFTKFVDEKAEKPRYLYNLLVTKPTVIPQQRNNSVHLAETKQYREEIDDYAYLWSHADTLEDEATYYKKQGYDVFRRVLSTYSSTTDDIGSPITPAFLKQTKLDQAHDILHEICHDTIKKYHGTGFVTEIDEPFCVLVEEAGTMQYFKERHGDYSSEYALARLSFTYRQEFSEDVNSLWRQFNRVYSSDDSEEHKAERRKKLLAKVRGLFQAPDADNAELWDRYTYTKHFPIMAEFYRRFDGNMPALMKKMEKCPDDEEKAIIYIKGSKKNNHKRNSKK